MSDYILNWKNSVAQHFIDLNRENQPFTFDIDEDDFIKISRLSVPHFKTLSKDEILNQYVYLVKPFGDSFASEIENWKEKDDYYKFENFPEFLFYVPVLIIPFNADLDCDYSAINFYDNFYDFWEPYNLFYDRSRTLIQDNFHPKFWQSLEYWLNDLWEGNYGIYQFYERSDGRGKLYVNHFFDHIVFRQQNLKRLPKWYIKNGILPNTFIPEAKWYSYLNSKDSIFMLRIPPSIHERLLNEEDNLTTRILRKIKDHHDNWDGIIKDYDSNYSDGDYQYTIASLSLCAQIRTSFEGNIEINNLYFRLHSTANVPDPLNISSYKIESDTEEWSKPIQNLVPDFKNGCEFINHTYNFKIAYRWDFPIILIKNQGLSDWIQVKEVNDTNREILLITHEVRNSDIINIIKENASSSSSMHGLISIHKLRLIKADSKLFDCLSKSVLIKRDQKISIISSLSMNNGRTFFTRIKPKFSITNSDWDDEVFLSQGNNPIPLKRVDEEDVSYFHLYDNEILNEQGYKVRSSDSELSLPGQYYFKDFFINDIPPRYDYAINRSNEYVNNIHTFRLPYINYDFQFHNSREIDNPNIIVDPPRCLHEREVWSEFNSKITINHITGTSIEDYNWKQNSFIEYLSTRREISFDEFYRSYFICSRYFFKGLNEDKRQGYRKHILRDLHRLGYVEVDYNLRMIYVNSATAIQLPNDRGLHYIIVGARNVNQIIQLTETLSIEGNHLKVYLEDSCLEDIQRLLPQSIFIRCSSKSYKNRICNILDNLNFPIKTYDFIIQEAYLRLSEDVSSFAQRINNRRDPHYTSYAGGFTFNTQEVKFKEGFTFDPDKIKLAMYLLEYGRQIVLLWRNGLPYEVNRFYGCFYLLKKEGVNILLYDGIKSWLAVPATIRLPFLIERGLVLRMGRLPKCTLVLNSPLNKRYYNIYTTVTIRLAGILEKKLGQSMIPFEINLL